MSTTDRRRRERERRRATILEAAAAVCAERGMDGASMDSIAERAELGKATLYYYFSTKDELHAAMLESAAEQFFTELARVKTSFDSLPEMLSALLDAYTRFCHAHPALLRTLWPFLSRMHWAAPPDSAPVAPHAQPQPLHQAFVEEMDRLIAHSNWRDRREAFYGFINDIFVALGQLFLVGRGDEAEARVEFYVDLLRNYLPNSEGECP